ncbi:MAG TPA: glycosyltransferase [Conexibacter sp.]|nr:glycosyltransferase [Conexibacter sp.]
MTSTLRVALVHDYLLTPRGAERTFAAIAACWPEASVHALLADPDAARALIGERPVRPSALQRLGVAQDGFRRLLPAFPLAARRLLREPVDLVVSSSSAFAHGVRPPGEALHVCYCHSPFRYAWHERARALEEARRWQRAPLGVVLEQVRRWDVRAAARVSHYVANSRITQERIERCYGREAPIVHPPVAVERFSPRAPEDYVLFVGEVTRHKRVELAIEAARRADVPLVVVGSGPELERLRALHGDRVRFTGRVDDAELVELVGRARAQVVPNVEEFGIAAVEAQASGRPVVAAAAGGALETVIDGVTGVHVEPGSVDALAEALREVDFDRFDSAAIRAHAERFSTAAFQRRLIEEVQAASTSSADAAASS